MLSEEREIYLSQFREISIPGFYSNSLYNEKRAVASVSAQFTNENTTTAVVVRAHEKSGQIEKILLRADAANTDDLGIYKFGDPYYIDLTQYYQLPNMLLNYGMPTRVLFAAWQLDPIWKAPYDPMSLVLIYDDLGVMVEYVFPAEKIDKSLKGCPIGGKINLFAWSKEADLSLEDVVSINPNNEGIQPISITRYKSIDDATTLTLDDFYRNFLSPDTCLITPVELWPPT